MASSVRFRVGTVSRRSAWSALVVMVLALATAVQTLPTPDHWGDRFATNVGDPVLQMWVFVSQVHHPLSPLQGNIFYGHDNVLAYSDSMIPYQIVFFPVYKLAGDNPIAGYNAVLFAGYLAGALAVYALARRLVRNEPAALVGALLFTLSPYRSAAAGHLQLVGFCFYILALLFLIRFLDERRIADALLVGLMIGLTWLGSLYCFMMLVLSLAAILVVWCARHWRAVDVSFVRGAVAAGAVAVLLIGPTLPAYIEVQRSGDITRAAAGLVTVQPWSFTLAPGGHLYTLFGHGGDIPDLYAMYPGLLLGISASVGAAVLVLDAVRRRRTAQGAETGADEDNATAVTPSMRTYALPMAAAVVMCILVMIGPNDSILLSGADKAMRRLIPGMSNLRDLTRFWLVPLLALSLVAAQGVALLTRRLRPASAAAVAVAICAAAGYELVYGHTMATVAHSGAPTEVNAMLAKLPPGPVVEVPLPPPNTLEYAFTVAPRQLRSLIDGNVRLEGYTGSIPGDTLDRVNAAELLPSAQALAALRADGLRYIVVHGGSTQCSGALSPGASQSLLTALQSISDQVERILTVGDDSIVVLRAASARPAMSADLSALPAAPRVTLPLCGSGALGG